MIGIQISIFANMDSDITFENYLETKLIDGQKFQLDNANKYKELEKLFCQMNPESFTAQKLFMINPLRRKYQLKSDDQIVKIEQKEKPKKILRPKIRR